MEPSRAVAPSAPMFSHYNSPEPSVHSQSSTLTSDPAAVFSVSVHNPVEIEEGRRALYIHGPLTPQFKRWQIILIVGLFIFVVFLHFALIIPTPTELFVSSSSKGQVTKKLILRNNLSTDVLLKIVQNPEDAKCIHLDADHLRIAGRTIVELTVQIYMDRIGMWNKTGHLLKGYVRVVNDDKIPELTRWMNTDGAETKREKAFQLAMHFSDKFSAQNTIIDLPGSALMVWSDKGPVGVDDVILGHDEEKKALRTARDCESIADYVKELRSMKKTTEEKGWISSWLGETKDTINYKMEATPCAGGY